MQLVAYKYMARGAKARSGCGPASELLRMLRKGKVTKGRHGGNAGWPRDRFHTE